jgi:hypothetical protein
MLGSTPKNSHQSRALGHLVIISSRRGRSRWSFGHRGPSASKWTIPPLPPRQALLEDWLRDHDDPHEWAAFVSSREGMFPRPGLDRIDAWQVLLALYDDDSLEMEIADAGALS